MHFWDNSYVIIKLIYFIPYWFWFNTLFRVFASLCLGGISLVLSLSDFCLLVPKPTLPCSILWYWSSDSAKCIHDTIVLQSLYSWVFSLFSVGCGFCVASQVSSQTTSLKLLVSVMNWKRSSSVLWSYFIKIKIFVSWVCLSIQC